MRVLVKHVAAKGTGRVVSIGNPNTDVPQVSTAWRLLDDVGRTKLVLHVKHMVENSYNEAGRLFPAIKAFELVSVTADGSVTLKMTEAVGASERGIVLRWFERMLRQTVSPGLEVYVAPKADRNALRRLRGVEVKE